MSRFGEGDGEEFPGQYELWLANAKRAIEGARGQRALRDLEAALLELPEKKLIHGHLAYQGQVCAIGALVTHRRMLKGEGRDAILADLEALAPTLCYCGHPEREHVDGVCQGCVETTYWWNDARDHPENQDDWGRQRFQIKHAPTLCSKFEDSDETDDYGDVTLEAGKNVGLTYVLAWEIAWRNDESYHSLSDEERYERTLKWVRERIKPEPVAA